jgi:hypothetical protein
MLTCIQVDASLKFLLQRTCGFEQVSPKRRCFLEETVTKKAFFLSSAENCFEMEDGTAAPFA